MVIVTKKIKNNYYLYEQHSHRDDTGKVKTDCKYVGKAETSEEAKQIKEKLTKNKDVVSEHPEWFNPEYRNPTTNEHKSFEKNRDNITDVKHSYKGRTFKTESATAAYRIKEELKEKFPDTKFTTRSKVYSGGDSVDIEWTNGPTTEQVEKYTSKYQEGHFDGMIDLYEYSNTNKDIPQAKYVFTRREVTDEWKIKAAQAAHELYGELNNLPKPETKEDLSRGFTFAQQYMNWHDVSYRILQKIDLRGGKDIKHFEGRSSTIFGGFSAVDSNGNETFGNKMLAHSKVDNSEMDKFD